MKARFRFDSPFSKPYGGILLIGLLLGMGCSRTVSEDESSRNTPKTAKEPKAAAAGIERDAPDPVNVEHVERQPAGRAQAVRKDDAVVAFENEDGSARWSVDVCELAARAVSSSKGVRPASFREVTTDEATGKVHVDFGPELKMILSGEDGNVEQIIVSETPAPAQSP